MEFTIYIIGFLFISAVLTGVIWFVITQIIETIKDRKTIDFKLTVQSSLSDLDRWCAYEFPIVEDVCNELSKSIQRGCHIDSNSFREKLRNKYPKKAQNNE